MLEFAIAFAIALLLLVGSLVALRRKRFQDLPPPEVVERVKQREREIEAREKAEALARGESLD